MSDQNLSIFIREINKINESIKALKEKTVNESVYPSETIKNDKLWLVESYRYDEKGYNSAILEVKEINIEEGKFTNSFRVGLVTTFDATYKLAQSTKVLKPTQIIFNKDNISLAAYDSFLDHCKEFGIKINKDGFVTYE